MFGYFRKQQVAACGNPRPSSGQPWDLRAADRLEEVD